MNKNIVLDSKTSLHKIRGPKEGVEKPKKSKEISKFKPKNNKNAPGHRKGSLSQVTNIGIDSIMKSARKSKENLETLLVEKKTSADIRYSISERESHQKKNYSKERVLIKKNKNENILKFRNSLQGNMKDLTQGLQKY